MLKTILRDRDEPVARGAPPHLSYSRVSRYLTCPEQYRLYYIENLRPRVPPSSLAFGQIVHQSLAEFFGKRRDPIKSFEDGWALLKGIPLALKKGETWEKLKDSGLNLLERFLSHEVPKIGKVTAVERPFSLSITGIDVPLVGIVDLLAEVGDAATVVDWKTAGSAPNGSEAPLSDQLTVYKMAEPAVNRFALCILVKGKNPQIEWHMTERSGDDCATYLAKAGYVAKEIGAGRFYRRTGLWCSWCDYLPLCTKELRKAHETLVSVS